MKIELTQNGCTLSRESGDVALGHETLVAFKMKTLLNAQGFHFVRYNPSKSNLTDCRLGLIDRKAKIVLWHERYQIENAHQAYNAGSVSFQRVNNF